MEDNLFLNLFSIILYSFALILSLIIAAAVLHLKLYHGNLRALLINVSFTHCFVLIVGLSLFIFDIFEMKEDDWIGKRLFYDFQTLCVWATAFNMLCLFCERVIASIFDEKYETMCIKVPWIGLFLAFIDWFAAGLFLLSEKLDIISTKVLVIAALSVAVIALLTFSFMPSLTYKRYMNVQTKELFSLSQRYQISENYRSAKLLTKVVWSFGGACIFGGAFYTISFFVPERQLFLTIYDYAFISQTIFYPILVIFYEIKVRDFIFCNKIERDFIAKSINGKNLVISNRIEQCEAYFNGYKQAWA